MIAIRLFRLPSDSGRVFGFVCLALANIGGIDDATCHITHVTRIDPYLLVVPQSIHAGLAASEVRLIDDIVVDQTGRVHHLRKEGDLSLFVY